MVTTTIERNPTETERGNFIPLGTKDIALAFKLKLEAKHTEFTKRHEPFDYQCAKIDHADAIEKAKKERGRSLVTREDMTIASEDLDKYGREDRFKLIGEAEEVEQRLIDGLRTSIFIGKTKQFVCKERGHGISVFVPADVLKEKGEIPAQYDRNILKSKK